MGKEMAKKILVCLAVIALVVGMGYFSHKQRQAQMLDAVMEALKTVKCSP